MSAVAPIVSIIHCDGMEFITESHKSIDMTALLKQNEKIVTLDFVAVIVQSVMFTPISGLPKDDL
jgi:hypothetical protein